MKKPSFTCLDLMRKKLKKNGKKVVIRMGNNDEPCVLFEDVQVPAVHNPWGRCDIYINSHNGFLAGLPRHRNDANGPILQFNGGSWDLASLVFTGNLQYAELKRKEDKKELNKVIHGLQQLGLIASLPTFGTGSFIRLYRAALKKIIANNKGSVLLSYCVLLGEFQRRRRPTIEITIARMIELTRLSRKTAVTHLKVLQQLRLINLNLPEIQLLGISPEDLSEVEQASGSLTGAGQEAKSSWPTGIEV